MAKKKSETEETPKPKPIAPSIYADGEINMHSSMIRDEESFIKLWKGNVKNTDLKKAYAKARKWRDQFRD